MGVMTNSFQSTKVRCCELVGENPQILKSVERWDNPNLEMVKFSFASVSSKPISKPDQRSPEDTSGTQEEYTRRLSLPAW